jgi:hypothetical protein
MSDGNAPSTPRERFERDTVGYTDPGGHQRRRAILLSRLFDISPELGVLAQRLTVNQLALCAEPCGQFLAGTDVRHLEQELRLVQPDRRQT